MFTTKKEKCNKIPLVIIINGGTTPSLNPHYRKDASFSSWVELFAVKEVARVILTWRYKNPEDISDCLEFIENNKDEHYTGRHGFDIIDEGKETEEIIENTLSFVSKILM